MSISGLTGYYDDLIVGDTFYANNAIIGSSLRGTSDELNIVGNLNTENIYSEGDIDVDGNIISNGVIHLTGLTGAIIGENAQFNALKTEYFKTKFISDIR